MGIADVNVVVDAVVVVIIVVGTAVAAIITIAGFL